MEIYVLTISEVFDFVDFSHKPKAFYKFEDAVAEMNSISSSFEKDTDIESEIDGDSWVIDKGSRFYDAYIDGRYSEYHFTIKINQVEVK